jgi:molecular chaperone Hsp33
LKNEYIKKYIDNKYDSTIQTLVGTAQLMVLVESGEERYQGIINLNGNSIVEAFKDYLSKSEQIDAELFIASSIENIFDEQIYKAAGIILKKMPDIDFGEESEWKKFGHFFNTITTNEIMTTSCEEILTRLFHQDGVIIFDKQNICFSCRCSREKMENIVKTIPLEEQENIKQDGKIEIKCQFCGNVALF